VVHPLLVKYQRGMLGQKALCFLVIAPWFAEDLEILCTREFLSVQTLK
jgi:hypothetical protein